MVAEFRYRAFISYCHTDAKWATWLHRAVESYRIPKPLVGVSGKDGPIPSKIFPVYRDREEFAAGPDLDEHIKSSLEQSAHLIVICSPDAVRSHWVNQEIAAFKKMGREDRILALIVNGVPNASIKPGATAELECFPEALTARLDQDGQLSSTRVEPVAADARPHADGKENAKLKIIAGLLGVEYDALKQRELEASRRRGRIYQAIAAGMFTLALLATLGGFLAYHYALRSEAMAERAVTIAASLVDQVVVLSNQFGVTQSRIDGFLVGADRQLSELYESGVRSPSLERQRVKVLLLFAAHYSVVGDSTRARARASEAVRLCQDLARKGSATVDDQSSLADAKGELASILKDQGATRDALLSYQDSLDIFVLLQQKYPKELLWSQKVSRRLSDIGWTFESDGNYPKALKSYQAALNIRRAIASKLPASAQAQHDVSASEQNIGYVLQKQGKLAEALANYRASEQIAHRIASADPLNSKWQSDDATSEQSIGDALELQGKFGEALTAFNASLEVRKKLASSDPENTDWTYYVATTEIRIGDIRRQQGSRVQALFAYAEAVKILNRLISLDSKSTAWPRDLYVTKGRIGDVLQLSGDLSGAIVAYRDALARANLLATLDPTNGNWQDDIASYQCDIGDVLVLQKKYPEAIDIFRRATRTILHLKPDDLASAEVQIDLAHSEAGVGAVLMQTGDFSGARRELSNALHIRQTLLAADSSNATLLHDSAIGEFQLAMAEQKLSMTRDSNEHAREAIAGLQSALGRTPGNPGWNKELATIVKFQSRLAP